MSASPLSYTRCTPNPFHPLWFYHPNNFSRTVQTTAFLIKKYSPHSCHAMWLKVWSRFTKLCAQQNIIVIKMIHTHYRVWNSTAKLRRYCKWTCNVCFVSPFLFLIYCKVICDNHMFWHQALLSLKMGCLYSPLASRLDVFNQTQKTVSTNVVTECFMCNMIKIAGIPTELQLLTQWLRATGRLRQRRKNKINMNILEMVCIGISCLLIWS